VRVYVESNFVLEPWETLQRRARDWKNKRELIAASARELRRTKALSGDAEQLIEKADVLIRAEQLSKSGFVETIRRVSAVARLLSLDAGTLLLALSSEKAFEALEFPDRLMLAMVVQDLSNRPTSADALFLNRNSKDFATPDVHDVLSPHDCAVITSFDAGLQRMRAKLPSPSP
jgi:hypothetical protein